eukprot:626552-Amphidinium_carterae.1
MKDFLSAPDSCLAAPASRQPGGSGNAQLHPEAWLTSGMRVLQAGGSGVAPQCMQLGIKWQAYQN